MTILARLALVAALAVVAMLAATSAQERVDLTTPVVATTSSMHVGYVGLDLDNSRIIAQVENASNAVLVVKTYDATTTPTGATLLNQLNLSTNTTGNSLIRKVYTRLTLDGVIPAGTVAGAPQ